jgi:hypothetical protein
MVANAGETPIGGAVMENRLRRRFRIETALFALSIVAFAATIVWPQWIEIVFGFEPDGGSGELELLVAFAFAAFAVAAGASGLRTRHRRNLLAQSS